MHTKASTFGMRQNETLTLSCHLLHLTDREGIAHNCIYLWTWMGIRLILKKLRTNLNDISKFPMLMVTKEFLHGVFHDKNPTKSICIAMQHIMPLSFAMRQSQNDKPNLNPPIAPIDPWPDLLMSEWHSTNGVCVGEHTREVWDT